MTKKWENSLDIIDRFPYDKFFRSDVGVHIIDPRKIIALSRSYDQIYDDRNMGGLRDKVMKHGWHDPSPQTFHLWKLLNGDLIVESGGNHRAILSNELGLERVPAFLTVIVPKNYIPEALLSALMKVEKRRVVQLRRIQKRGRR